MTLAALTLLSLGQWSFAGMVENPTPTIPPSPVVPAPRPPKPVVPPAPVQPEWIEMTDDSGQRWTDRDLAKLQTFIAQRNRELAAARLQASWQAQPRAYFTPSCATGSCPR